MPIRLGDILQFPNGAGFYTADLHVHSFGASSDVKDPTMTVEAIIDAAVAQGISVLSITDHNTDENVGASLECSEKYTGQLLVLPGVEITTANGHLLAYFPPEKPGHIRDLLSRIEIVGTPGEQDSHTKKSMADVIHEVERLGGLCIAAHIDRQKTGFEAVTRGYPNWKKDVIGSSGLYGLEFDDPQHLNWYSEHDEATMEGAERKKLLRARSLSTATIARTRLASVQNSDAHTLVEFSTQQSKRPLTKVKLNELTFDAIRTALVDPEARVRAVASIPSSFPRVLGMHINGGFLDGETYHLSNNLNCFIGGRGTGKSTALHSLAFGLGARDELEEQDNCPDNIVIYCEDSNGVCYRYERTRGLPPVVHAREDQSIKDVPPEVFHIEFYAQGEISEVAKDPLRNAVLLQQFLDRHIVLSDFKVRENALLEELEQNSAQLIPLEATASQLGRKDDKLIAAKKQLEIAETGKVKEIAAFQIRLAAEKTLLEFLTEVKNLYETGLSLANVLRDYDSLEESAGRLTDDRRCTPHLKKAREVIESANKFLKEQEKIINASLAEKGGELGEATKALQDQHKEFDQKISEKLAALRKEGLSGSVDELSALIKGRKQLSSEVSRIRNQLPQLTRLRERRAQLLRELEEVRSGISERRKKQLRTINDNLRQTIEDFSVNLYYDPTGITDDFKEFFLEVMHGTYFQEETASSFCSQVTPQKLCELVSNADVDGIARMSGVDDRWAREIVKQFQRLTHLHSLEVMWKPLRPVIKVLTKASPPKQISVNQLSDGQKHTILITVAMLAESNVPLLMDQPEDDLDNQFIFTAVVSTLRSIKEKRQVIIVTHNANIAVLGDSELILPMKREIDTGMVKRRGSIDRQETKQAVQEILEGGELAFRRRKEIYGY